MMDTTNRKLMIKQASLTDSGHVKQKGSSLIEVMVALFVLAIGLLGILSMQVKSMQYSQSAFSYSQAMVLANEILESMRSNRGALEGVNAYLLDYDDVVAVPAVDCSAAGVFCTPTQIRGADVYQWRQNVQGSLAAGNSSIEELGDYIAIKIQFDDSRSDDQGQALPTISEYVLVTEIN